MAILFSVEVLHHFWCGDCGQWWSIADVHKKRGTFDWEGRITCPNCEHKWVPEEMDENGRRKQTPPVGAEDSGGTTPQE